MSIQLPYQSRSREIVVATPAFCAGHDQNKAELRLPSMLGELRMWWRAAQGARDAASLRAAEYALFGASANDRDRTRGQGAFLASLDIAPGQAPLNTGALCGDVKRLGGASISSHNLKRPQAIAPGAQFTLNFHFRACHEEKLDALNTALALWLSLGGLGHMCRRGFGSLAALPLEGEQEYLSRVAKLVKPLAEAGGDAAAQGFPLLTKESRIHIRRATENDPMAALRELAGVLGTIAHKPGGDIAAQLSDQADRQQDKHERIKRWPSPVHIRIQKCSDATLIVATYMPTSGMSDNLKDRVKEFLTLLDPTDILA
jgi:hypothetical protein